MKIFLVIATLLSVSFACPSQIKRARSRSPAEIEQELRNLVTAWHDAEIRKDVATIDKLLAPEFSFLGGSSRKDYLEKVVPDESVKYFSTIENVNVQLYGNSAIVTTLDSFKGSKGEKAAEGKFLIMTVWVKTGPGWQCVKSCGHVVNAQVHAASNKGLQLTGMSLPLIRQLGCLFF